MTTDSESKSKAEMIRRLRLGDLKRVLRSRYGHELPDDDAGREDLRELLLPISLGSEPGRKMENAIQVWAPWMGKEEVGELIDEINQTPVYLRKPSAALLGQRLGLTYAQRRKLGIRTIAPCDLTEAEFEERRKGHRAYMQWKRRQKRGGKTRAEYLESFADSDRKQEPWKEEGKSRAQWFREQAKMRPGVKPIKLNNRGTDLVSLQQEDCRDSKRVEERNKKTA
jgi:hypothetical protein